MGVERELLLLLGVRPLLGHEGLDVGRPSERLGGLRRRRREEQEEERQSICQYALHVKMSVPKKAHALTY